MSQTRREFIAVSSAAIGSAVASAVLPGSREAAAGTKAARPLRILILGGTGFLGPACTESALARGHSVTQFNSGRSEERRREIGRPSVVPAGVEQLYGNRDPNKTAADRKADGKPGAPKDPNSPKGLSQLVGKTWDAVIDTSGFFPRMVKASAELLAPSVKQYVFISSLSVYSDFSKPGYDEDSPLATLTDPNVEDFGKDFSNYGGGKTACERAAEAAMPGRVTNVRPGYIVGPRDTSARFLYWPVRVSLGGNMIVPGQPADPIQIVDVRDLSDFIIRCIENSIVGPINVTGPEKELSMREMVEGIRRGLDARVSPTWIDNEFLKGYEVDEHTFPLYAPPTGKEAGFHRCSIARALKNGLQFRPLPDTAKVTLEWYQSLPSMIQAKVIPQFVKNEKGDLWLEKEKKILSDWQSKKKAG